MQKDTLPGIQPQRKTLPEDNMTVRKLIQATGYKLQAKGYRLQATGYGLQVTGYMLHAT